MIEPQVVIAAEEDRMTAREEGTEGRGGREGGMEGEREGG